MWVCAHADKHAPAWGALGARRARREWLTYRRTYVSLHYNHTSFFKHYLPRSKMDGGREICAVLTETSGNAPSVCLQTSFRAWSPLPNPRAPLGTSHQPLDPRAAREALVLGIESAGACCTSPGLPGNAWPLHTRVLAPSAEQGPGTHTCLSGRLETIPERTALPQSLPRLGNQVQTPLRREARSCSPAHTDPPIHQPDPRVITTALDRWAPRGPGWPGWSLWGERFKPGTHVSEGENNGEEETMDRDR